MHKKILSIVLCLALLASIAATVIPANAATTATEKAGAASAESVGKRTVESPDDFSWDNANVYFLLTDRFYNGNTSNDHSYGRATAQNGSALPGWQNGPGTFHGGDFAGITKKINEGYFDKLGTTAIWLSAPYEQIHGYVTPGGSNDFAHYSYHGYYVLDYTETDANFGTKQEFKTLVDTAHKHGIRVVMDIVMNHAGYNTIKDMLEFNFGTFKDKNAATSYLYKLNGVNGLHDYVNYSATASDWGRWWGSSWVRSGLPGYSEQPGSDQTDCLAGLPDFKTESGSSVSIPTFLQEKWKKEGTYNTKVSKFGTSHTVSDFISSWLADWVETYGVDGFRCDTAKHVEMGSWKKLKTKCSAALKKWRQNNPTADGADWDEDFWMTGEHWDHKLYKDGYFDNGFDSMINFSFSGSGVTGVSGTYQAYANALNNDENYNMLTYISSHDSDLAMAHTDMFYQGSALQLLPGGIQLFYGDESGRGYATGVSWDGHGDSGHSLRSDMNWSSTNTALLTHWQKVGTFRKNHVSVGAGQHSTVSATSGYAFSRSYDDGVTSDGIIAVIGADKNKSVDVTVSSMWGNGTTVTNAYDGSTAVVKGGKVTFNSGSQGTILIEGPQSTINMSIRGSYSFEDSQTVTVSLRGADYAMVSVNGGSKFRVTNGQTFEIGEGIEPGTVFEVTMTATNSEETLDKSFTFKKKNPLDVVKVYFDNTAYRWSTPINVYVYSGDGESAKKNADWPGEAMKYDSKTGLYVYEIPDRDDLENGKVLFSSSSGRYPGEDEPGMPLDGESHVFLANNKWEVYTDQTAEPTTAPDPSKTITVYYDNSSSNFSTPTIYYWKKGETTSAVSWPGVAMEPYKDNVYKYTIPNTYNCCIFSNGNEQTKTGDLDIPGNNYIYKNGTWSVYAYAEQPTTATSPTNPEQTVEVLLGDVNRDGSITIGDATAIQYHLAALKKLTGAALFAADVTNDNAVTIKDATMIQYYVARIKNSASKCGEKKNYQGGDVTPTSSTTPTQPTTAPTTPTTPATNKVYFRNTNGWSPVKAYFWSEANLQMMSWPGNDMQSEGGNVYSATIPEGATMVIFTKGDDSGKTADLTLQAGKIFSNGSWSNYDPNSTPTNPGGDSGKVYFKNNNNWSPVKAYFWSDSNLQMMSWPGNDMQNEGNGIYSATIPEGANHVIFTKGDDSGKTPDLDLQAGMLYDNGWRSLN